MFKKNTKLSRPALMKVCIVLPVLLWMACSQKVTDKPKDFPEPPIGEPLLAFPGAEGFGKYTKGARGVENRTVYKVTNLEDSGSGSFRDAVSVSGRFVVFSVSGIIKLNTPVAVASNTTIAGQTAPGDGVVLYGRRVTFSNSSNTIARFLRIRLGANAGAGQNEDASGLASGTNMIFDHMSFSWGLDEVFSINWDKKGPEPDSITIQNSIIGQGLHRYNHSAGGLMETDNGKISLLRNLYISNKTRNPKVKGINEFVNNVVYNFGNQGNPMSHSITGDGYIMGGSAQVSHVNIINNYFIGGPLTQPSKTTPFSRGTSTFNMYGSGNYFDNIKNGILDGSPVSYDVSGYPGLVAGNFMSEPFDYPLSRPTMSAKTAYDWIVEHVGATVPKRDQVDELLIDELLSKGAKGMYAYTESDLPLSNGGLGTYSQVSGEMDSDGDGIPDIWEEKLGLDANKKDSLEESVSHPGYLNIEVYINSLADAKEL